MKKFTIFLIKLYQLTVSPILFVLFGKSCRYEVTCSQYTINMIKIHGILKGVKLGIVRLSTCNKFAVSNI